ncbi:YqzK family protein [Brevibacillus sp. DP1.3A]|uniref:YqzK family protein n=1 Tax=Brevibacillus sp. DP1.3A TaxID=2738867 RepID=UPI00156ADE14|nr:YqzK family protein [Brevibacillus sp. DP1.3A]UED72792.1 YqzK family protein [Brevibacillus sp. DP1.3A]
MKVSYRRLMEGLRFLLLFITCTLLSYGIITLLADKFLPANPYQEPHGNAVKVVKVINTSQVQDFDGYVARLQLFFLTGE